MLKHQVITEILWILIAAVLALAVLAPPILSVGEFLYQYENALIVFGFITVLRLLFFHRQAPWLGPKPAKGALCIAMIPVILFTILTINNVQTFVDANGFAALFGGIETDQITQWGRYLRNEVIFFGAGLLICAVILPVVLIIEVWRQVKGFA